MLQFVEELYGLHSLLPKLIVVKHWANWNKPLLLTVEEEKLKGIGLCSGSACGQFQAWTQFCIALIKETR